MYLYNSPSPFTSSSSSFFFFFFAWVLKLDLFFQILRETIHITSEYLSQEAKTTSAKSKVEVLEAENSKLRKDLIFAMDDATTAKEKAKILADDLRVER